MQILFLLMVTAVASVNFIPSAR